MALIYEDGVQIAFDVYNNNASKSVVFLHGIMANRKNWASFAKAFCQNFPEYSAYVFDLRDHGESQKGLKPHTVLACALDIKNALMSLNLSPKHIFGHSFGAKVAILLAQLLLKPTKLWLLDASPSVKHENTPLAPYHTVSPLFVLEKLKEIKWPLASRSELLALLRAQGLDQSLALWMTTNLKEEAQGLSLVFEPNDLSFMLNDFLALDSWPILRRLVANGSEIHLVKAEFGGRISENDEIIFNNLGPKAYLHLLKNLGHFLHVEDPQAILALIKQFV